MTERVINTLGSMFHRKAKPMTDEIQLELPLENPNPTPEDAAEDAAAGAPVVSQAPTTSTIIGVFIAGSGSDTPELHTTFTPAGGGQTQISVSRLSNPVTAAEIASILSSLN